MKTQVLDARQEAEDGLEQGCSARSLTVTGDFNNPDTHCWEE